MGTHWTLTNDTSERLSFALAVDFYDPEGFRFTQAHVTVTDLLPGATEEWGSWLSRGSVTVDSDGSGSWDQAERDAADEGFTCVVT